MDSTATAEAGPRKPAVRPRHAASLIVVGPGPRVLMGMRGARHRFMPNRLVFPGGAVDPADSRAPCATPLPPDTQAHLHRNANPSLTRALGIAAARELEEETGLTLGTPPRLDGLHYLCRAVTPPDQPIRFNARFLVVDEKHVTGTLAGSGELENLQYYETSAALALDLAWITRNVLLNLLDWLELDEAARLARTQTPVCRAKSWRME